MDSEAHKMNDPGKPPMLYATESTRAALGAIGNEITKISGINTLVVTRADIAVLKTKSQDPDLIDTADNPSEIIDWGKTNGKLRTLFNEAGYPVDDIAFKASLPQLSATVLSERVSATSIDYDQDGTNDFGFIIAPDMDTSPEEYVSILTGIPADKLMNVPGDAKDYLSLVLYHESAHLPQPHGDDHMTLMFETDADMKALEKGRDIDPKVLEMWRDARIAGSLPHTGTEYGMMGAELGITTLGQPMSHETGFFLNIDNGLPQMSAEAVVENTRGMTMVNMTVNYMLGTHVLSEIAQSTENGTYEETLEKYGITGTDAIELTGNPFKMAEIGASYGAMNPGASYAALQALDEKGYLKTIPGSDVYIKKVGDFYDKHVAGIQDSPAYEKTKSWLGKMANAESPHMEPAPSPNPSKPDPEQKQSPAPPAFKN